MIVARSGKTLYTILLHALLSSLFRSVITAKNRVFDITVCKFMKNSNNCDDKR